MSQPIQSSQPTGSIAAGVKLETHHAPDMYVPPTGSSRILWTDAETTCLLESIPKHLDTRGDDTIVRWSGVAKDMADAGYLRSAGALSAHYHTTENVTSVQAHVEPTHPRDHWLVEEEQELWRLAEQCANKSSGKVDWQKVHDLMAQDKHERSRAALVSHLHKLKAHGGPTA